MYDDLLGKKRRKKDFVELEKLSNQEVCRICKDTEVDYECHKCPMGKKEDFNAT